MVECVAQVCEIHTSTPGFSERNMERSICNLGHKQTCTTQGSLGNAALPGVRMKSKLRVHDCAEGCRREECRGKSADCCRCCQLDGGAMALGHSEPRKPTFWDSKNFRSKRTNLWNSKNLEIDMADFGQFATDDSFQPIDL
jgi:hypothetical protein